MSQNLESRGWNYLEERFGVSRGEMEDYSLKEVSGDLWLVSRQAETGYDVETWGFRCLRTTGRGLKPTTYALQFFGKSLEKNVVEVGGDEIENLLKREEMIDRELEEDGYVALKYNGRIIGCGFYRGEKVSNRIPKGRSKELLGIIND